MPGQGVMHCGGRTQLQERPAAASSGFNTERDPQRDWLPGESDFGPADFGTEDPGPEPGQGRCGVGRGTSWDPEGKQEG